MKTRHLQGKERIGNEKKGKEKKRKKRNGKGKKERKIKGKERKGKKRHERIENYCFLKFFDSAFPGGSIGKASILLFRRRAGSSPTRGGRLVADARDQQPFEPGEWGLRVVLSGHFCASLHVGHARRIRPVFNYRITDLEAQIKTNKQTISLKNVVMFHTYFCGFTRDLED